MSDEGYTDEALLHDGDESAVVDDGDAASNENNGSAGVVGGGDDPELEAIKARVKQGRRRRADVLGWCIDVYLCVVYKEQFIRDTS